MFYGLNRKLFTISLVLITSFYPDNLVASGSSTLINQSSINEFIEENIKDSHNHFGLAQFYGGINAFILNENALIEINEIPYKPSINDRLIIVGRYKILVVDRILSNVSFSNKQLMFHVGKKANTNTLSESNVDFDFLIKSNLTIEDGALYNLKYVHLWSPLRALSNFTEKFFVSLNEMINGSWGMNIIALALIFKLLSIPNDILLSRSRKQVNSIKGQISPLLSEVKGKKIGAEAQHYEFMKIHKQVGVSPFYELRPLIYTALPIPFLIAIFNVLGESFQLSGQSFLWVNDLAYPDDVYDFSFTVPLIGNTLHLLPIIMLFISILLAVLHYSPNLEKTDLKKQKINLFLTGVLFAIIFYPFPAALILFWIFTNIFGSILKRLLGHE